MIIIVVESLVVKVYWGRTEGGGRKTDDGRRKTEYTVKRTYELPVELEEQELILEVSRTWIPHGHLKNFDRRKLGVGVRILGEEEKANIE